MTTRMADSEALVARAQKVGWRTERGSGGKIKVYPPNGGPMISVHMTYSDVRSLKNVTAALDRVGLREAEENMAQTRFTAAVQNTARGRATAAKKVADAKLNPFEPARAAGPYVTELEDPGIMWFAQKHPAPWTKYVNMTPEIAKYLLENHNTSNRPINDRQVEHNANIILSGQWRMTHQGGAMDTEAVLQDSQHRLKGIVRAAEMSDDPDLKVPFMFTVGMDPENFKAIDEGLLRTAAQLFARSDEKNGSTLQTSIRLVIAYRDPEVQGFRLKIPNGIVVDQFGEDPDEFRAAANHAQSHYRKYRSSAGAIAASIYLLRRANGKENRFVDAFFEGLRTGLKTGTRMVLDDDDPRAVYRETMERAKEGTLRKKFSSRDQMGMIITAWNNVVTGYQPRYMKYNQDTPPPRINVCHDTGPHASLCPQALVGEIEGDDE